jgi:Asp-tRNA(Asn)/Glu-tRNA(Gln) amidotransferase A subunit family amidase
LPIGLQIIAAVGADDLVLRASRAYELIRPLTFPDLALTIL